MPICLKIDRKTNLDYYFSLLRQKHTLVFIFYTYNIYKTTIIKYILFLFSFCLFLTVDELFFTDPAIHKIYHDNDNFSFINLIPQIYFMNII